MAETKYQVVIREVKISDRETQFRWNINKELFDNRGSVLTAAVGNSGYTFMLESAKAAAQEELDRVIYNAAPERVTTFYIEPSE